MDELGVLRVMHLYWCRGYKSNLACWRAWSPHWQHEARRSSRCRPWALTRQPSAPAQKSCSHSSTRAQCVPLVCFE